MSKRTKNFPLSWRILAILNVLAAIVLVFVAIAYGFGLQGEEGTPFALAPSPVATILAALAAYFFFEGAVFLGLAPPAKSAVQRFRNSVVIKFPMLLIGTLFGQLALRNFLFGDKDPYLIGPLAILSALALVTFLELLDKDDPKSIRAFLRADSREDAPVAGIRLSAGGLLRAFVLGGCYVFAILFFVFLGMGLTFVVRDIAQSGTSYDVAGLLRMVIGVIEGVVVLGWFWALLASAGFVYGEIARVREFTGVSDTAARSEFSESHFSDDERSFLTSSFLDLQDHMRNRAYPDYFGWDLPLLFFGIAYAVASGWPQNLLQNQLQTQLPSITAFGGGLGGDFTILGVEIAAVFLLLMILQSLPFAARFVYLLAPRYAEYRVGREGGWRNGLSSLHRRLANDVHRKKLDIDVPFSPARYLRRVALSIDTLWPAFRLIVLAVLTILFWPSSI